MGALSGVCDGSMDPPPPDNRRDEIQHGTHFVKQLHLCANGSCYIVCTDFFKQTFEPIENYFTAWYNTAVPVCYHRKQLLVVVQLNRPVSG